MLANAIMKFADSEPKNTGQGLNFVAMAEVIRKV